MRRDPIATGAAIALALLVMIGLFGPLLPIGDATAVAFGPRLSPPDWRWPFGTDELGRTLLPRVVEAIGATFVLASAAVLVTAAVGTLAGLAAGYARGLADHAVMRLADILFSVPPLLLAILIVAALGPGDVTAILAIALITLPQFVRVVRAVTLGLGARDYVVAASVAGASTWRILVVHLLPNVAGAAVVQLAYALSVGMLIESALSFLGLGVQPPQASLGSLLRQGAIYMTVAPWLVFAPGIVLTIAIVAVNLLGDRLRDLADPLQPRRLT